MLNSDTSHVHAHPYTNPYTQTLRSSGARLTPYFALCLLVALIALPTRAEWLQAEREMMGTRINIELWAADVEQGETLIAAVFAEFDRLDQMMNPWNTESELARINRHAAKRSLVTTPEIVAVIARAQHYARLSDGAFDISFASAGQHYDYRAQKKPSKATLASATQAIDYRAIELNEAEHRIRFKVPSLQLDLGGIAKGYAVDRGIEILRTAGIQSAIISAGGDSRILGGEGDAVASPVNSITGVNTAGSQSHAQSSPERPRTVGIRHPRKDGEFAVLIPLANTAISTSGDYERFFIQDGVRYHHILDPSTGDSARDVQSASVLAPQAIDSDALSTTVFVLGVERGLALINSLPGIDAIFIDGAGKLHYSQDLLRSAAP